MHPDLAPQALAQIRDREPQRLGALEPRRDGGADGVGRPADRAGRRLEDRPDRSRRACASAWVTRANPRASSVVPLDVATRSARSGRSGASAATSAVTCDGSRVVPRSSHRCTVRRVLCKRSPYCS